MRENFSEGFVHGPLSCEACFAKNFLDDLNRDGFRLDAGPGYWGAPDPTILVLGQTRGARQKKPMEFDKIAFNGIRDRLLCVLAAMGIENLSLKDPDKHFLEKETELGFASVLRCSLSFSNGKTSGSPLTAGLDKPSVAGCVDRCINRWLGRLNARLKLVVILGLTAKYRDAIFNRVKEIYKDSFSRISKDAVRANGVVWVVAQHPSTISENHYQRWISNLQHPRRDEIRSVVVETLKDFR